MTRIVFLDTETTGLADECDVWEIGIVQRPSPGIGGDDDVEFSWVVRPDLTNAEPTGLRIGRYYDRIHSLRTWPVGQGTATAHPDRDQLRIATEGPLIAAQVADLLDGVTIVGAVPDFDTRHLSRWLRANGQCGTWHYHLIDVETLAAGALRLPPPWNFDSLLETYGLKYDETDRHTALGDARMVRDLYDAVMAGKAGTE